MTTTAGRRPSRPVTPATLAEFQARAFRATSDDYAPQPPAAIPVDIELADDLFADVDGNLAHIAALRADGVLPA